MDDEQLAICAYHESGHAVMAVTLGAKVHQVSLAPEWDDGPAREGDIEVHWPAGKMTASSMAMRSAKVALAGPAAEMVYIEEPLHPAMVAEWKVDWQTAWTMSGQAWKDERLRLRQLEQLTREIYSWVRQDAIWQAIAAVADELQAHETVEGELVHDVVATWIEL